MRNFDENYSLIRALHAVAGGESFDIYLNNSPFFYNMRFTKFSPYVYVPKGTYLMRVFLRDKKYNPIVEQMIEVNGGELLTLAVIGEPDSVEILSIKEDIELPPPDKSKARLVNLVPNSVDVNVLLDGELVVSENSFKDITPYEVIEPKTYRVEVELSENNQLIRKLRVTIRPDRIYTFYAMGNKPNFQLFQSLDGATFLS